MTARLARLFDRLIAALQQRDGVPLPVGWPGLEAPPLEGLPATADDRPRAP